MTRFFETRIETLKHWATFSNRKIVDDYGELTTDNIFGAFECKLRKKKKIDSWRGVLPDYDDLPCCPECGSLNVMPSEWVILTDQITERFFCPNCIKGLSAIVTLGKFRDSPQGIRKKEKDEQGGL